MILKRPTTKPKSTTGGILRRPGEEAPQRTTSFGEPLKLKLTAPGGFDSSGLAIQNKKAQAPTLDLRGLGGLNIQQSTTLKRPEPKATEGFRFTDNLTFQQGRPKKKETIGTVVEDIGATGRSFVLQVAKTPFELLNIATAPDKEKGGIEESASALMKQSPFLQELDKGLKSMTRNLFNLEEGEFNESVNIILSQLDEEQAKLVKDVGGIDTVGGFASQVVSGGLSMGEALGIYVLTKNPSAAAAVLSTQESAPTYREARAAGKTHEEALQIAAREGVVTFALEKIGLDYFLSANSGPLMKALVETIQEELQTIAQNLNRKYGFDRSQKIFEGWAETAIGSYIPTAILSAVSPVPIAMQRQESLEQRIAETADVPPVVAKNTANTIKGFIDELRGAVAKSLQIEGKAGLSVEEVGQEVGDFRRLSEIARDREDLNIIRTGERATTEKYDIPAKLDGKEIFEISVDSLLNQDIQGDKELDPVAVAEAVAEIQAGNEIAPIVVQVADNTLFVEDGKNRVEALRREDIENIKAIIEFIDGSGLSQRVIEAQRQIREAPTQKAGLHIKPTSDELPEVKRPTTTKTRVLAEQRLENKRKKFLEQIQADILKELNKPKGQARSTIAFVKRLGGFNQTAINDAKKKLNITNPISKMNLEELQALVSEMKERLAFNTQRGNRVVAKDSPAPEFSDDFYAVNQEVKAKKRKPKSKFKKVGVGADKLLGSISTRLKNIDPSLKRAMRRHDFNVLQSQRKSKKNIEPYVKAMKKELSKEDFFDLDLALKNGDTKKINEINEKYGLKEQYESVRAELDDLYKRANEVGYDIGYKKNYMPRMIKDSDAFIEYFESQDNWSVIQEAIRRKEMDLGRYLQKDEKAYLINTLLRGYRGGQITLSKTGAMKERKIDFIDAELNQFYYDSVTSLIKYTEQVNEAIEARKLFGKSRPVDKKEDPFNNMEDSIGFFTAQLLTDGKISLTQEQELRDILSARFNPKGTHGLIGIYKNLAYIDVMGSPLNAITQVGDLAFAMYRGGSLRAIKEAGKSAVNLSEVTKEDLGIDAIAQELSDQSKIAKAVNLTFRVIGLEKMDTLGKESLINSVITKWQKLSENPSDKELAKLKDVFGAEIDGVLADLRSGEITENVKFLAFNELMDSQPLTLSEVPEAYVRGGNGRIFYQLKTWSLKMLDVYRNEVIAEAKTDKIQAAKNMIRLTALLVLMNGTADEIKDFLRGKETPLKDRVVDQLLTIAGFSRYYFYQAERDGIGSAMLDIIKPPTKLIDNLWKDSKQFTDFDKSVEINKLSSLRSLPFVGEFYYWWFGKGADYKDGSSNKKAPKIPGIKPLESAGTGIKKIPGIKPLEIGS